MACSFFLRVTARTLKDSPSAFRITPCPHGIDAVLAVPALLALLLRIIDAKATCDGPVVANKVKQAKTFASVVAVKKFCIARHQFKCNTMLLADLLAAGLLARWLWAKENVFSLIHTMMALRRN